MRHRTRCIPLLLGCLMGWPAIAVVAEEAEPGETPTATAEDTTAVSALAATVREAYSKPSTVTWPAGRHHLGELLVLLNRSGNPTALALGAHESQQRELPAFTGTYWEGVLAICQAFDLRMVPPRLPRSQGNDERWSSDDEEHNLSLHAGPLALAPRQTADGVAINAAGSELVLSSTASGAVLIEVIELGRMNARRLRGDSLAACCTYRLRLEPRLSRRSFFNADVVWAEAQQAKDEPLQLLGGEIGEHTAATSQSHLIQNRALEAMQKRERMSKLGLGSSALAGVGSVTVGGLRTTSNQVHLAGTIEMHLGWSQTFSPMLRVGDSADMTVNALGKQVGTLRLNLLPRGTAKKDKPKGDGDGAQREDENQPLVIVEGDGEVEKDPATVPALQLTLPPGLSAHMVDLNIFDVGGNYLSFGEMNETATPAGIVCEYSLGEANATNRYIITCSLRCDMGEAELPLKLALDVP